jgi:transposase
MTDKRKSGSRFRGLRALSRAGRKSQLGTTELRRIERALKRGPEALGYESGPWTSARVALLIERECGIRYHPAHAWRIVRQLVRSCQGPPGRRRERGDGAIRRRKKKRWQETKKRSAKKAEPSSSSTKAD